ncbi:acyl-CoA dehydrogenase family protein, partial [Kribbella sp. NPDC056345]|uniref:acyl-CoA dehydrogenase family protein n=1 Tax=Kribbella sp. NPDC056345 TaxID=3345789 RepID=UPI0035E06B24
GMLKVYATELAVEITQRAVQIHGATGALIETTYADTFRVTLPAVRLDEGPPTVDGFGVVKPTFNFTGLYDGTNQPKIEIISTEATL